MQIEVASQRQSVVQLPRSRWIHSDPAANAGDQRCERHAKGCAFIHSEMRKEKRSVWSLVELLFVADRDTRVPLRKARLDLDCRSGVYEILVRRVRPDPGGYGGKRRQSFQQERIHHGEFAEKTTLSLLRKAFGGNPIEQYLPHAEPINAPRQTGASRGFCGNDLDKICREYCKDVKQGVIVEQNAQDGSRARNGRDLVHRANPATGRDSVAGRAERARPLDKNAGLATRPEHACKYVDRCDGIKSATMHAPRARRLLAQLAPDLKQALWRHWKMLSSCFTLFSA
ncbi:hypothetical protein OSZ70_25415 [Rhizobium leguminosarum]